MLDEIIEELNSKLSNAFEDFEGVYLYGSRLRGDYTEDSDVDLIAIFKYIDLDKRLKIWPIVGQIEYKYDLILDLHPMTIEELKESPYHYDLIVNNGKFYEAA